MNKSPESSRATVSLSRRAVTDLQELRRSLEAELHDTVNLGDIFDAVMDVFKKAPHRLSISRKWQCEKAISHMQKVAPDICTGLLDTAKAKAISDFLTAKAEESERAVKSQSGEPLGNAEPVLPKTSRKRAGKIENPTPQDAPQIREGASETNGSAETA